jgi:hypothetical protein
MLRVSPQVFDVILYFIHDHPVFYNNSNNPQAPVQTQLAVTLYRMGRYGNGASVKDIARIVGISEGSVENYTEHCLVAIESLHDIFVRKLTPEEKEVEKKWMDEHLGFVGSWRDGWVMYDGTIVVLYAKPGLHGDAYYTRKANYGLNVQASTCLCCLLVVELIFCMQIGNVASNLRIVDYSHGMTGSAHDSAAFAHTGAAKYPDWFFDGEEFAWADFAYTVNSRTIPVHKQPASSIYENTLFDGVVSHLRVRSEHCIGVLKGRFQCLRGLRVNINSNKDHVDALRWITVAIILHNLIIDVEGHDHTRDLLPQHGRDEEVEDRGPRHAPMYQEDDDDAKRRQLVMELVAYKCM